MIDLTEDEPYTMATPSSNSNKRKAREQATPSPRKSSGKKLKLGDSPEEKRLKPFRKSAPQAYLQRLDRAHSQRMFLIDRKRRMNAAGYEEEVFDLAGSTGNVYQVTISKLPKCTCPDNGKGNQCKHIVYILVNVLKAPSPLSYQLAFLESELRTLFANAPISPQSFHGESAQADGAAPSNRKPLEGDCPVCVMEFEPATEDIVWCRASCGQNIHKQCFEQWASSKAGQGTVRCVYCRAEWQGDEKSVDSIKRIAKNITAGVNEEGYVNIADELGLSGERDASSYHYPWRYGREATSRQRRRYDRYDRYDHYDEDYEEEDY